MNWKEREQELELCEWNLDCNKQRELRIDVETSDFAFVIPRRATNKKQPYDNQEPQRYEPLKIIIILQ